MENQTLIDFMIKFNELNETNQQYIMAIQQALVFAQASSVGESQSTAKQVTDNNR